MRITITVLVNWVAFEYLHDSQNVDKHRNGNEYIYSERDVSGT